MATAAENIKRIDEKIAEAQRILNDHNIPAVIWSPLELYDLEVFDGKKYARLETHEQVWSAWQRMHRDILTDQWPDDHQTLINAVEAGQ